MNKFWNFRNESETEGELTLYGAISQGTSWWDDVVSSTQFAKDLKDLGDVKNITVRINSGGGDVFAGHAIYALLKDHPANVTVKIDGFAASAASVIAMAGDEIIIPNTSFMMIHNPASVACGEAKDFTKMAETLNTIKDGIVNAYVAKTGKDKKTISKMMDNETWMTGEDAVAKGFADKIEKDTTNDEPVLNGNMLIVNSLSHDISKFKTRPHIKNELDISESNSFSIFQKFMDFVKGAPQAVNSMPVANIINKQEVREIMEIKNVEDLRKNFPDLVNQVEKTAGDTAVAEAIKNERSRIQDIEKIAKNISPELVNKAKFEEPIDAKELAFNAMQCDDNKGQDYLDKLKKDAENSGAKNVPGSTTDNETEEEKKIAENKAIDNISAGANGSSRRGRK